MTPQEMIPLLKIETDTLPPWDGEVREIRATVMENRQPVRVRVLDIYEYWGRRMVTVQALRGEPFPQPHLVQRHMQRSFGVFARCDTGVLRSKMAWRKFLQAIFSVAILEPSFPVSRFFFRRSIS